MRVPFTLNNTVRDVNYLNTVQDFHIVLGMAQRGLAFMLSTTLTMATTGYPSKKVTNYTYRARYLIA